MIHNLLKDKQVILASASPRRSEIFKLIGVQALQIPAEIDESISHNDPRRIVRDHAMKKARTVALKFDNDCLIIGADTIVYQDKEILGKPAGKFQAADYLSRLSGRSHYVYTGISIEYKHNNYCDYTKSRVEFKELTALEIEEYLHTDEPFDKAGAYGIQGYGSQFISKITGCYFNVMGFPVYLFYDLLKRCLNE